MRSLRNARLDLYLWTITQVWQAAAEEPGAVLQATTEKRICMLLNAENRNHHVTMGLGKAQSVNKPAQANFSDFDIFPFSSGINEQNQPNSAFIRPCHSRSGFSSTASGLV